MVAPLVEFSRRTKWRSNAIDPHVMTYVIVWQFSRKHARIFLMIHGRSEVMRGRTQLFGRISEISSSNSSQLPLH
jgi:hypothetical protein